MDTWIYASAGSGGTSEYGPKWYRKDAVYLQVSVTSLTAERYFQLLGAPEIFSPEISGDKLVSQAPRHPRPWWQGSIKIVWHDVIREIREKYYYNQANRPHLQSQAICIPLAD
jgi:hypothetical protein